MKQQNSTTVKLSRDKKTLIVTNDGAPTFVSVNLVKHLLDIPYTKKDGTVVSLKDIKVIKERSREAYAQAVSKNLNTKSVTSA